MNFCVFQLCCCVLCSWREDGLGEVAISKLVQMRKVSIHASSCFLFLFSLLSPEVRAQILFNCLGSISTGH